jgi:soluble lytic murein transglycosylase
MFYRTRKPLVIALAGLSFVSLISLSCHADDLLTSAVSQFRHKSYADSFSLALKSADSPQRTFLMGVSALRQGRAEESLPLLVEAEKTLPLLGDYAAYYQAQALFKVKKYSESAAKAAAIPRDYPGSQLIRDALKLQVDSVVAAGDYGTALKLSQAFVEKYPSGADSVDALYISGVSREETGDRAGAVPIYRSIWLNSPLAPQAAKSQERLVALEKLGVTSKGFSPEELLCRASAFSARNSFSRSLQTLQSIQMEGQPAAVVDLVVLRTGLNQYRMRNWKGAEKSLIKAGASSTVSIRSEARFWLAKALEHLGQEERVFAMFMELAAEGEKQDFADEALMEAAGMRKGMGRYAEAAGLYAKMSRICPRSKHASRAAWEAGWCHYLAGEHVAAVASLKALLNDDSLREKALYWLGRALERSGNAEASDYFSMLLNEYPAGFYAAWYRERKGIRDNRESLGQNPVMISAPLPTGYEKPRLLAALGMIDEARREAAAVRRKNGDKKAQFPSLARLYLEMGDYGSAISLFQQNRPIKWEKETLPLWTAGYPLAYRGQVAQQTTVNNLSEALIYALIRTESCFSPGVKSSAGAIGLMQLMPATARATSREKGAFNPARLTTPDYNIMLGTRHFRELMKGYDGDVVFSVAAYNAGATAVGRWRKRLAGFEKDEFIESIPYQETRDYVKKVYASAATYRQLYGLR